LHSTRPPTREECGLLVGALTRSFCARMQG
jgi:hypothetical protein